jgi:ABC-type bacteriocin/lantibiotic exporter with double-glycine peptidase domain
MSFIRLTLRRSSKLLSRRDKKVLGLISVIQVFLSLLDLLGLALMGILGALSINGIQSRNTGSRVSIFLEIVGIEGFEFQAQVAIIGCVAVMLLLCRTLLTVYFTRRVIYYLTIKSARVTGSIASSLFARNLTQVKRYTNQELLYSLTFGVNSIMVGIIGTAITLFSDVAIFVVILFGLLLADFSLGISALALFVSVGLSIYSFQQRRARHLGITFSKLNIESEEKIVEALSSFREITVHNRQQFYADQIERIRVEIAHAQAEMNFMPQVSKYVIETTLVVGTFIIGGIQFYLKDASNAVAALAIFMAAGSRIAPAVLRLQQGMVTIRTNLGSASPTLDLIEDVGLIDIRPKPENVDFDYRGFRGVVSLDGVTFTYPGNDEFRLEIDKLVISEGFHVAIVGPSGSGKTTLADLILGVISPDSGHIEISGLSPNIAISKWPGAISYVPQDVSISNSTLIENIALGFSRGEINYDWANQAMEQVDLRSLVGASEDSFEAKLGERGGNLSGGQRQRIGIARALYTQPRILVLDEATSALDGDTELVITNSLNRLDERTTLVTIAHRLSTVRNSDLVVYMEKGRIIATGSFLEVRDKVPNFDRQANLMGLKRDSEDGE